MRRRLSAIPLFVCALVLFGACGGTPLTANRISSIALAVAAQDFVIGSGVTIFLAPGETIQLSAKANMSDGSTIDVTQSASWTSDDTGRATVSNGLVTGVTPGAATIIRARIADAEGTARFGVNAQ